MPWHLLLWKQKIPLLATRCSGDVGGCGVDINRGQPV